MMINKHRTKTKSHLKTDKRCTDLRKIWNVILVNSSLLKSEKRGKKKTLQQGVWTKKTQCETNLYTKKKGLQEQECLAGLVHTQIKKNGRLMYVLWGFPGGLVVKNPPANARDAGSISGSGRSPGRGNGNPLQYSCLGNPLDRGAWWGHKQSDIT